MAVLNIQNLNVKPFASDYSRMAASFTTEDARYHVWFDPATMQLTDRILYKNPPKGTQGQTRQLDATNATNAPTVAALLKLVVDLRLVEAAQAQFKADVALKERENYVRTVVARYWAAQIRGEQLQLPSDIHTETFKEYSLALAETIFPLDKIT